MTRPLGALPDFERPPVVEVVFAVAVEPLPVSLIDLSAFALEAFGTEFPLHHEQPPMRMARESFDERVTELSPALALLSGQAPMRLWLQSADQDRLIQLQRDYLACNWQKSGGERPYPRYSTIESFLLETWDKMAAFAETKHATLAPVQCELWYVNRIEPGDLWIRPGQLDQTIALLNSPQDFLPEPEHGQLAMRFRIREDERDVGRLYVNATSPIGPADMKPVIQLTMTARGAPLRPGRQGMVAFFQLAHEWIVRGFAAVTTEAAQASLWGRTQ